MSGGMCRPCPSVQAAAAPEAQFRAALGQSLIPHCTPLDSARRSARGHGPGRSQQQISSDNYLNNFRAFGPIMNGAKIIDEPRPTLKPAITSVTQWTPRYRRVTQMNTMSVSAAAHSR